MVFLYFVLYHLLPRDMWTTHLVHFDRLLKLPVCLWDRSLNMTLVVGQLAACGNTQNKVTPYQYTVKINDPSYINTLKKGPPPPSIMCIVSLRKSQ